jgi:hypothetical protein
VIARAATLTLVSVCAALISYRWAFLPFRANVEKREIQELTRPLLASSSPRLSIAPVARRNAERALYWGERVPEDAGLHTLASANLILLNRHSEAAQVAERALRYDQRPEIYFNLGLARLASGDRPAALAAFQSAVRFIPSLLSEISDPVLRGEVHHLLLNEQRRLGENVLRNARFDVAGLHGAEFRLTGLQLGPSAAAEWRSRSRSEGGVLTRVVSSTRSKGSMLEIRTSTTGEGVAQLWQQRQVGPGSAETSAWVFVLTGTVAIGSAKGLQPAQDAVITEVGRWILAKGVSSSCPADQTLITSTGGSAHFLIDEVHAAGIAGSECDFLAVPGRESLAFRPQITYNPPSDQ